MPRYTVLWHRDIITDLAEIWFEAVDRNALTRASNNIDRILAVSPETSRQNLAEGLYVLVVPPLKILFVVREADRVVEVVSVRLN
jgi:hypothetical protein